MRFQERPRLPTDPEASSVNTWHDDEVSAEVKDTTIVSGLVGASILMLVVGVNGYAKQLLKHLIDRIFMQNKSPYLHVSETNLSAIKLYRQLGFTIRRKISFWHIVKS